jgi:hypothetical protein
MGGQYSGMCCHNNYTVKNSETDLDLYKRDMTKTRQSRLNKLSQHEEDQEEEILKNKRNKEFLDRHIKDNSSKLNSFTTSRIELQEKINKLSEVALNRLSPIISLKVLNSSSNLQKGTVISMNCQGLLEEHRNIFLRNGKDGVVYFGYYPETQEKDFKEIDYEIPVAKGNGQDKSEQANM